MIQRIQTVYLLLAAILSFACLISNVACYKCADETVAVFNNFTFSTYGSYSAYQSAGPYALGTLLILVIVLTLMSIMLFRKRMRQLRLVIFSSILLVGYVLTYSLFAFKYAENLLLLQSAEPLTFHLRFAAILPVLCFLLNCLAIHGIRKDEALVRSLDRLR